MRIALVRIGNSRGIRIPRSVIEQSGIGDTMELEVRRGALILRPPARRRAGWDEAFRRMARQGDDRMLDRSALRETAWERREWRW